MPDLLPPGLSPLVALTLTSVSLVTSLLSASMGLGGGMALIAVMAALLPPAALVPVHGVVQLGSNAGRALVMRAHVDRAAFAPFVAGSAIGAAAGGFVAVDMPAGVAQVGVGLFVLWSIVGKPPAFFRRAALPTGIASSFLSMFFGATGPFVAAFVRALGHGKQGQVATHAAFMTAQHLLKSVVFGVFGFAFAPWAALIAAMLAAGLVGTLIGERLLARLPETAFRRILTATLAILGVKLTIDGALALAA